MTLGVKDWKPPIKVVFGSDSGCTCTYTVHYERYGALNLKIEKPEECSCPNCGRSAAPEHIAASHAKCWWCESKWSL